MSGILINKVSYKENQVSFHKKSMKISQILYIHGNLSAKLTIKDINFLIS